VYEYLFVQIPIKKFASKTSLNQTMQECQQTIHSYAHEGWRLVQIFTPVGEGLLVADHYEIILEKELAI
jgi:hypothetical protein